MGAQNFYHIIEGYSAGEAFDELFSDAIYKKGHDSYNGTISTCSLGYVKKMSSSGKYTKSILKKAMKYMEEDDYGSKWRATCLDLGIVGYDVITAKKTTKNPKTKAEYRQKYVVFSYDGFFRENETSAGYRDSKKEADALAMKLALKNNLDYYVAKRPVNVNRGEDVVSEITYTTVRKNTKPKSSKDNTIVKPVHKYLFYGWAAS